jgi:hypothetical protein
MAYITLIVAVAVNGFGNTRLPPKKPKIPVATSVVVLSCALILTYWPGAYPLEQVDVEDPDPQVPDWEAIPDAPFGQP